MMKSITPSLPNPKEEPSSETEWDFLTEQETKHLLSELEETAWIGREYLKQLLAERKK